MAEPARVQCLHKARLLYDACHDVAKATAEAEGMPPGQKKHKTVAAAPACLKGRVGRGEELPEVELVRRGNDDIEDDEHIRGEVLEYVVGGGMLKEIYYELMNMMAMRWDDARSA